MTHRFLVDENFPLGAARWLEERGHDVLCAASILPGGSDDELLKVAIEQRRILLTFDQDFGDRLFRLGLASPPGVVLFRLGRAPRTLLHTLVRAFFESDPDLTGHFVVVTPGQYRRAPLSSESQ